MRRHRWAFTSLGQGLWEAECRDCGADTATVDRDPEEADAARIREYGEDGATDCDERQVEEVMRS